MNSRGTIFGTMLLYAAVNMASLINSHWHVRVLGWTLDAICVAYLIGLFAVLCMSVRKRKWNAAMVMSSRSACLLGTSLVLSVLLFVACCFKAPGSLIETVALSWFVLGLCAAFSAYADWDASLDATAQRTKSMP